MPVHNVTEGDCLSSIAEQYGFFWETLWNHPQNAEIVERRKDPNTLMPGDAVFIPEKRMKSHMRPTGARHTWKVKGVPAKFRIQVLWGDEPMRNEPYVLAIDGEVHEGTTDGDGKVEAVIPPGALRGSLKVGAGARVVEHTLMLGSMPPAESTRGALERLRNLGFYAGERRDDLDADARGAVLGFQVHAGLDATGEIDDATRSKLRQLHDGV